MKKEIALALIGSVIAAAIISALEYFKVFHLFSRQVPIWVLIITILILILIGAFWITLIKKRLTANKRIFIISSAFTSTPFFSELIKDIIHAIETQGYEPIVKLPIDDFNIIDMNKHIEKLYNDVNSYSAGIFIHAEPDKHYERFQSFSNKFKKPLLFLDCHKNDLYKTFDNNCSFIGFDNSVIGKIASDTAISILIKKQITAPKILIIASKLQSERQNNFASFIRLKFPNCELTIDDSGEFNRKISHRIILENLKAKIKNNEKIWDLIFCTNDEMAIGTLTAIKEINNKLLSNIIVLGCDGIEEAKAIIDKKNKNFINTVDQSPKLLSDFGVEMLFKKIKNHDVSKEVYLLPKMYIPIY
ncbi:MAG: HTH-type transcriptional repressor PurR [Bacteroidia bacterium]|nr:HTH-type transcriptional repressor PurR [Bacteroidia bacterium]